MKNIAQRNLPLDTKYTVIDKKYIPVLDGGGCACDNCGRLIANIATVKSENGIYNIGLDCMETFLLNNNLLENFNVADLKGIKKMISQCIRFSKNIKKVISENISINITGLLIEKPKFGDWVTFYWLKNGESKSRDNDVIKLKEMDFDFLVNTIESIFPELNILVNL